MSFSTGSFCRIRCTSVFLLWGSAVEHIPFSFLDHGHFYFTHFNKHALRVIRPPVWLLYLLLFPCTEEDASIFAKVLPSNFLEDEFVFLTIFRPIPLGSVQDRGPPGLKSSHPIPLNARSSERRVVTFFIFLPFKEISSTLSFSLKFSPPSWTWTVSITVQRTFCALSSSSLFNVPPPPAHHLRASSWQLNYSQSPLSMMTVGSSETLWSLFLENSFSLSLFLEILTLKGP